MPTQNGVFDWSGPAPDLWSLRVKTFKPLFLCLAANLITGCTVVRETLPERTATEQLMLSYAVRASVQGMNLKLVNGRSVFLDTTHLKSVDQEFAVELRVELEHEKGMIAMLASTITSAEANIERISLLEKDAHLAIVNIVMTLKDRVHLARVIRKVRHIHNINKIIRLKG